MRRRLGALVFGGLAAGLASPAVAQCLSIPDGTGGLVVHCADGQVGQLRADAGGGVAGMVGAEAVAGSVDPFAPPAGLASGAQPTGYKNPHIAQRTPPLAPPSSAPPQTVMEERPFSAYPDPESAGLKVQPGE